MIFFRLHLCGILEEKDKNEKALVNSKTKFETYSMQILPQAQAEVNSNIFSCMCVCYIPGK